MSRLYLKALVDCWDRQLQTAKEQKEIDFGRTARTLWGFMSKSYRQLYIERSEDTDQAILPMPAPDQQGPYYMPRLMKCREFVNLVVPFVHAQVPRRIVTPSRPPMPAELRNMALSLDEIPPEERDQIPPELLLLQSAVRSEIDWSANDQIAAWLQTWYQNYIIEEYGAHREQRTAIIEALVKGRGIVWHGLTQGPGGLIPSSHYDTVDGLFVDPDAKQWRDCGYIFRERTWPAWRLSDVFEINERDLVAAKQGYDQKSGRTKDDSDALTWYEVFSRIGPGARLHRASETLREEDKGRTDALEQAGNNVYFAFLPGLDHPLNIPPETWERGTANEIAVRMRWPIAFHEDKANPFPGTPLDIYPDSESPWAVSPLYAGIALQTFIDQVYSFLMTRLRVTCRDIIVTAKVLEEGVRNAIASGLDQYVVTAESAQVAEIEKLVHILKFPPVTKDMWIVLANLERAFEMATGMDPLLYGSQPSRQIRSAQEASIRHAAVTNRPNDYADAVEKWNSQIAKAEGAIARRYIGPQHIAPFFRETVTDDESQYGALTRLWGTLVNVSSDAEAVADMHYTVESYSGRRKDKQAQIENFQVVAQTLGPTAQAFGLAGITGPWNGLLDLMQDTYELPAGVMAKMKLPAFQPPQQTTAAE